ncbi:transmembrane protein, putative [Medicago truncatula]|uniref:Transmembrane protein, putative n=1 Tax=Medicago truncatula TaxID=3880 RepID=G7ZX09_MEDTR|nr:transmembrane protein, putative [Medicago truncatula]
MYVCVCVILTTSLVFPLHTVVAYLTFDSTIADRAVEALFSYHCLIAPLIQNQSQRLTRLSIPYG